MNSIQNEKNLLNTMLNKYFYKVYGEITCKYCKEKAIPSVGDLRFEEDFWMSKFYCKHIRLHGNREDLDIFGRRWGQDKYVIW